MQIRQHKTDQEKLEIALYSEQMSQFFCLCGRRLEADKDGYPLPCNCIDI